MVMEKTRRAGLNWQRLGLRVAAAVLVSGSRLAAAVGAGVCPLDPRRLPPVGVDRLVRVQGDPDDCGDRRRGDRGRRFRCARPTPSSTITRLDRTSISAAFRRGDDLIVGERNTRQRPGTVSPEQAGRATSTATGGGEKVAGVGQ
jgi:hypothetical protein